MPHGWQQSFQLWPAPTPGERHTPPPAPPIPPPPPPPPQPPPPQGIPFVLRRNPRARRYILRIARDGTVLLTIPRGGNEAFARRFALEKEPWIRAQLQRLAHAQSPTARGAWGPGTEVWFRGQLVPITTGPDHARIADLAFPLPSPDHDWRPAVEHHLRNLASSELPPLVFQTAATHQLAVRLVQVRSQRTRWGSCSRKGTISLNWRLVQVPVLVRDYIVAHELAHLRQMNHSSRFWAVVAEFFPAWREAEQWLRANSRRIMAS